MEAQLAPGRILLQPALKPRPLTQESLVGDLDVALAAGQQTRVCERLDDCSKIGVAGHIALAERYPSTYHPLAFARASQAQKDGANQLLLVGVEGGVGVLGQARHRTVHSSGRTVS